MAIWRVLHDGVHARKWDNTVLQFQCPGKRTTKHNEFVFFFGLESSALPRNLAGGRAMERTKAICRCQHRAAENWPLRRSCGVYGFLGAAKLLQTLSCGVDWPGLLNLFLDVRYKSYRFYFQTSLRGSEFTALVRDSGVGPRLGSQFRLRGQRASAWRRHGAPPC